MKKHNLIVGILFTLVGTIFLLIALFTNSILNSLFFGFAGGGICSGIAVICKYFYWNRPKNRERYRQKMEMERIELQDELKIKLRDKSGRYAYQLGLITICFSIIIFFIFDKLNIIHSRTIILFLSGYFLLQVATQILIFNHLIKKY